MSATSRAGRLSEVMDVGQPPDGLRTGGYVVAGLDGPGAVSRGLRVRDR